MFTRITAAQEADWRHRNPRRVATHPQRLSSLPTVNLLCKWGRSTFLSASKEAHVGPNEIINRQKFWNWKNRPIGWKRLSVNVRLFEGHLTVFRVWFNNQNIPAAGPPESNEIGSMPLVKLLTSGKKRINFLLVVNMAEGGGWTKRIWKKQSEPNRKLTQMRKQQQNIASFFDPIHQTADVQRLLKVK